MIYKFWLNEWLEDYVKPFNKIRTHERYSQICKLHIIPSLGDYDLTEISASLLQKFVAKLLANGNRKTGNGLSANFVNAVISVLQNSLQTAFRIGLTFEYVANKIKRPKVIEKHVNCFSVPEQKKIEQYVLSNRKDKLFGVVLCLYTGLRIGELLALTWDDINLQMGIITVRKSCRDSWCNGGYVKIIDTPKTDSSMRSIPIPKQLLPRLKALKKKSGSNYVIDGKTAYGVEVRSYQNSFDLLLKRLHIEHKGFHSLRHTFATHALECGMDVKTLSEILGHKNPTITLKRYAHSMFEHKVDMMNKIGKLLL